jgi:transcriptional regulator with XRE-family HTH domain
MWPHGQRRHSTDAARLVAALVSEFGAAPLAGRCGVSDRTIRRWASGEDWPEADSLHRLIDSLYPQGAGWCPVYSPDMAIDGNTRVGGVGEYTRRAARGDLEYLTVRARTDGAVHRPDRSDPAISRSRRAAGQVAGRDGGDYPEDDR